MFAWHAPEERITDNLEFRLNWQDSHTESESSSENFLAGKSTFGQSRSASNYRPFSLSARNTFYIRKPIYIYSWLNFEYNRGNNSGESWSLTANDQLMKDSVNQTWSIYSSKNNSLRLNWQTNGEFKMPWGDELELDVDLNWNRQWGDGNFSQNRYTLFNTGTFDQRNQYTYSPYKNYGINGQLAYRLRLTENFSISPRFSIDHSYNTNDDRIYRLDWLGPQWAVGGPNPMGSLPAADQLALALDAPNSSEQSNRENQYSAGLMLNYSKSLANNNGYLYYYAVLSKQFHYKHMSYDSNALHTTMNSYYDYLKLNFHFNYSFDHSHKSLYAYGQNSISLPSIGQLADITQTNNPLYGVPWTRRSSGSLAPTSVAALVRAPTSRLSSLLPTRSNRLWNLSATVSPIRPSHSRRGYADDKMNDNRLYWDVTLTKSWKQGRWVAKLKGYDLLGQVTQWQYYVTSQGRTEYWTNNMRRYVLLSLAYRFSLTPKKK